MTDHPCEHEEGGGPGKKLVGVPIFGQRLFAYDMETCNCRCNSSADCVGYHIDTDMCICTLFCEVRGYQDDDRYKGYKCENKGMWQIVNEKRVNDCSWLQNSEP